MSDARHAVPDAKSELDRLSAVDVADLLLAPLATGWARSVVLEDAGGRCAIRCDDGEASDVLATLDPERAAAVEARLATLAGLRSSGADTQLGKLRVRMRDAHATVSSEATDLLVVLRGPGQGPRAEVHRVASHRRAQPLVAAPLLVPPPVGAFSDAVPKYRIDKELGRGGMGIVYRGEHLALEKPVAIKVLHPEAAQNPVLAAQFVVEARASCRARHPGIVEVTDFGALSDGRAFIVMELVEAPTLARVLSDEGPLAPARAGRIVRHVAEALAAAAAHGVVHRDVTPANVFVLRGDRTKIGDFGVARILDGRSPAGAPELSVVGTAVYMSPEQGRGEAADARSDVYSLGCVLFKALTGRVPFEGRTLLDILERHATRPVPAIVGKGGPVPEPIARVVRRALAKAPADRYPTAGEMADDLRRAVKRRA